MSATTPPPKPRALNKSKPPYKALSHLANAGPTEASEMEAAVASFMGESTNPRAGYHVLRTLITRGFVKNKLWLTPEGLAELRSMGWEPSREETEA